MFLHGEGESSVIWLFNMKWYDYRQMVVSSRHREDMFGKVWVLTDSKHIFARVSLTLTNSSFSDSYLDTIKCL